MHVWNSAGHDDDDDSHSSGWQTLQCEVIISQLGSYGSRIYNALYNQITHNEADAPQQDYFLLSCRQVLRPLHERAHLLCNHVAKRPAPTRICAPYGVHELFRQLTSADFGNGPPAAYREVIQNEEDEEVEQERVEEDEGARVLVAQEEAPTRQGDLQGAKGWTG